MFMFSELPPFISKMSDIQNETNSMVTFHVKRKGKHWEVFIPILPLCTEIRRKGMPIVSERIVKEIEYIAGGPVEVKIK